MSEKSVFRNSVEESQEQEKKLLKPNKVIEDFQYSGDAGVYTPPFASSYEWWDALLNGSEGSVLCSMGEPIISRGFAQCGGALVRNRETGLITLIHQSQWSAAAEDILRVQRNNNIDVIIMNNQIGHMRFKKVLHAHQKTPNNIHEHLVKEGESNWLTAMMEGGVYKDEPQNHLFQDGSRVKGLTLDQLQSMGEESKSNAQGETHLVGEIQLPTPGKWSLVYRPGENRILIYVHGSKQLFVFDGFEEVPAK